MLNNNNNDDYGAFLCFGAFVVVLFFLLFLRGVLAWEKQELSVKNVTVNRST